jgi:hypothetical protein
MFRTTTHRGSVICDECHKIIKRNVPHPDNFNAAYCPACDKEIKRKLKEAADHPFKVGDKAVFGIRDKIYLGTVYRIETPTLNHDQIATARHGIDEVWFIYKKELSAPIGGDRCWTRKVEI